MTTLYQALTRYGRAVHQTTHGVYTLCGYPVYVREPEVEGEKFDWRIRVRDLRICRRCELAVEALAEGGTQ